MTVSLALTATVKILTALAIFLAATGIALTLRHLAFRTMEKWSSSTAGRTDDIILQSLRTPTIWWSFLIGLYIALEMADFHKRQAVIVLTMINALLIISVTATAANLVGSWLRYGLRKSNVSISVGLSVTFAKVTVWIIGLLVLLSHLGIQVTPILTALGVGGLAMALALQDTLSNFFAGLHLLIDRAIHVGDFVRLETGQEGYIVDIGWRTTRIRTLANDLIIVPNNKLTQTVLTNYARKPPVPDESRQAVMF